MEVFVFSKLNQLEASVVERAMAVLPASRREKALRRHTENKKRQSMLAYLLLIYGLRKKTGCLMRPELVGEGKPYIRDWEELQCSISHCSAAVAAVVDDAPVGVDIEALRPYQKKLAGFVCSEEELAEIEASLNPDVAFTVLWTKKESFIKLHGGSVGPGMKQLSTHFDTVIFETKVGDGWVVTACHEK